MVLLRLKQFFSCQILRFQTRLLLAMGCLVAIGLCSTVLAEELRVESQSEDVLTEGALQLEAGHESEQVAEQVMLVLDVSGSMWGQIAGKTKIEIARESLGGVIAGWPETREVGLIAYGHRRRGDCSDIETLIAPAPLDRQQMLRTINALTPRGMTPLVASVQLASEQLRYSEQKATVILISDGIENCGGDPCELADRLAETGVDFTAHVIGFDVGAFEDQQSLSCLAERTGGLYVTADNAAELNAALERVTNVAAQPVPVVEESEPALPEVSIDAPPSAMRGSEITVMLDGPDDLGGRLHLNVAGREESLVSAPVRSAPAGGYRELRLRLPFEVGDFELRWVGNQREVFAATDIELTDLQAYIDADSPVSIGAEAIVTLSAPEGLDGRLHLYPQTQQERSLTSVPVRNDEFGRYLEARVRMPAETGEYVLQWKTSRGELVAQTVVEVADAEVRMEAPGSVAAGTQVSVTLVAPDGLDGRIHLFAAGRDRSIQSSPVRAGRIEGYDPVRLRLPSTPGTYRLEWRTGRGDVVAELDVEATAIEVLLTHDAEVVAGAEFDVQLDGPDGLSGRVHLYAAGRDRALLSSPVRAGQVSGYNPVRLRVPTQVGNYEVRWETDQREVLASSSLSAVQAEMSLEGPRAAEPDSTVVFQPDGSASMGGRVHLLAAGSDRSLNSWPVRDGRLSAYEPVRFRAPVEEGEYLVRWLHNDGAVLAESSLRVDLGRVETNGEPTNADDSTQLDVELSAAEELAEGPHAIPSME